jgi:hypothetical protein
MAYPQPNATDYATNEYDFFSLKTILSSPGDIYESDQGAHGIAIGPDSDIANVNMAYFDENVPVTLMTVRTISPLRAFVGSVLARNTASYAPAQRPGRVLFWADDIYDPNYRPRSAVSGDTVQFIAPVLDIVPYFAPMASIGPARVDKSFVFQNYLVPTSKTLFLVVPYYGRKFASINFTNRSATIPNTFGIIGVNYAITDDSSSNPYHQETVIRAPGSVAAGVSATQIIKAGTNGTFDALVFSVTDTGPAPLRILMSDRGQA